jgi:chorismate synthase
MSMRSIYRGEVLDLEIYGESHSPTIGVLISGLPEGVAPDEEKTRALMKRRAPGQNKWSTPRKEKDEVIFEPSSDGRLHGYIINSNTKPKDYASIMNKPRPSHADFTAKIKYGDKASESGGGIFSGRMTAPMCIAGSIALQQLALRGISIYSHVKNIAGVSDDTYFSHPALDEGFKTSLSAVAGKEFPVIDDAAGEKMKEKIEAARMDLDSVGGVIETVVYGMPAGIGGPIFDGLEGKIAQIIYAVPAVKGIEFGNGFEAATLKGSENNDAFKISDNGEVVLATNRSGGILGGITVGGTVAPIVFDCCLKPTPSIGREQDTVDIKAKTDTKISIEGRHDPCIVPRAVPVIEAATAIAIYDRILAEERGM